VPVLRWWFDGLIGLRFGLGELLTVDYPAVGRAMYYQANQPYDWHLLIAAVVACRAKRLVAHAMAWGLSVLLFPLIAKSFKVTFTRDAVTVHRWFRSRRLVRNTPAGVAVSFRVADTVQQRGLLGGLMRLGFVKVREGSGYAQVLAIAGLRPLRVASPRRVIDAERVVQSLQLAMQYSRNTKGV